MAQQRKAAAEPRKRGNCPNCGQANLAKDDHAQHGPVKACPACGFLTSYGVQPGAGPVVLPKQEG